MQCIIWTSPGGGLCNMDRCYKLQYCIKYLESVLQATFMGISYSTVHGTITVYECDTMRIGTLAHAFWVRVSFPEVQSSVEAGHTDVEIGWPLLVRRARLSFFLKRTATITQAGAVSQTLRSGTVAFNLSLRRWYRVYISISKGDYREVSCLGEHNMQATSPLWVNKLTTTEFKTWVNKTTNLS